MSIFLMGCYDPSSQKWCTVTKCSGGHDDATLARLQKELDMVKISKVSKGAAWPRPLDWTLSPSLAVLGRRQGSSVSAEGEPLLGRESSAVGLPRLCAPPLWKLARMPPSDALGAGRVPWGEVQLFVKSHLFTQAPDKGGFTFHFGLGTAQDSIFFPPGSQQDTRLAESQQDLLS